MSEAAVTTSARKPRPKYRNNDLWDIVSGRSDRFDERFEGIVARLRAV